MAMSHTRRSVSKKPGARWLPSRRLHALVLVSLLAACAHSAEQGASIWPEELRIRGSVMVLGEDVERDAVRARFLELAGGDQAKVVEVVIGSGQSAASRTLAMRALDEATGVWLLPDPNSLDGGTVDGATMFQLQEVIQRGGVVAAVGKAGSEMAEAALGSSGATLFEGMRLMPGVVLHSSFRVGVDRSRLLSALEAAPRLFGIGLPDNAAVELNGRSLSAVVGEVVLIVPAGMDRPVHEERLRAGASGRGNEADLTAWRRDAIERTLPPFPSATPAPPNVAHGTLIIIGGGVITDEINEEFLAAAGGGNARLVFVPPEEGEEVPGEPVMVTQWKILGVANSTWIHTKDRERADNDRVILDPLRRATGVFFGGGRQWNFADSYYGTTTHRLMREVLDRGGVIAGTSAGASVQAEWMARGDPLGNENIIAPGYERGLGFITGVAIDQHFTQRDRRANMEELMATYPQLLGIGIDESTAIVVRGSVARVIGAGRVFMFDRRTNPQAEPVVLSAGAQYDLSARRVIRETAAQPAR
jgi:cyanophycinase